MLKVVFIMLSGTALGTLLRRRPLKYISLVIMVLVWILLFILGVEVGSDPRIVRNLQGLGLEALLLTAAGLTGSMMTAWWLWKIISGGKGHDEE